MFDWLFGKKPPALPERVWIDDDARWAGIVREATGAEAVLLVAFFEGTLARARSRFVPHAEIGDKPRAWDPSCRVHLVRADHLRNVVGRVSAALQVIAVEAHPLPSENRRLLESLGVHTSAQPMFHSAIDDALMDRFGGERLRTLMDQMGMSTGEPIEHPMVSQALARAREKISAKVRNPREAGTVEEWFERNLGG